MNSGNSWPFLHIFLAHRPDQTDFELPLIQNKRRAPIRRSHKHLRGWVELKKIDEEKRNG